MSIMDMFSGMMGGNSQTTNQPAAQTQPTQGNIPAGTGTPATPATGAAPNGVVPEVQKEVSPLDQFSDLWKNDETTGANTNKSVFGDIDPKKFTEAAGKIDFSKAVTPEQLQAISQGGEGAVQAFASAMNAVSQSVYAQSAFASTKIVEQALARAKDNFMADLPQHIKKQTVTDSLRAENPIFSNPAVQPIISALEAQMTVKYPNATASEITSMAKQYVEALGTSFSPKAPEASGSAGKNDTNWEEFLMP